MHWCSDSFPGVRAARGTPLLERVQASCQEGGGIPEFKRKKMLGGREGVQGSLPWKHPRKKYI